ncbi:MAG: hypothetical protein ACO3C5_10865 [Ilumatobacteraceae bacterium]
MSVLFFAACGGGGGGGAEITVPEATGENQSSGLIPNPNGFAFPNFGSAATAEVFNEADLVEMFGNTPEVCVDGADPCVATAEAAGWARMVNESRAAGHCEGFAVLAAARFMAAEQPNTVELVNQGDVTHALMRGFATQFFDETKKATKAIVKKSMRDKVAILEAAFAQKKVGDVVGVYSDMGGHALLPYAIEYTSPDVAKIMIYDSNWPGQERFITVDMAADTWTFPFGGPDPANDPSAWTGGTKDFDIAPYDARIAGTCPFCKGDSAARQTLLVIRSVANDWSIKTADGTLTPGSNVVGEATVRPMRSSAPQADGRVMDFLVTLPADAEVELTLPSLSRVTGVTPQATIQIDTKGSATKQVTVAPDTITADDPNTVVTLADGNLVGTANGANNSVTTAGAEVTVTVDSADGTPVTATANEVTNAVEVRTPGREGVTDETNYEVVTQASSNAIDRRIVNLDGSESTSQEDGRLANTQVYQEPPAELAVPAVKPGLPSAESRAIGGVAPTTTSSTTTVAGTTTTTSTTTTTIAGSTTSGVARPTTTAPRASTTVAQTQTTTAQNANVRKNVVVTTNLDGWGPGLDDPISSGFSAKLTGGLGQLDGDPCADVACLESVQATILGGGTDSATGQDTVVPATFTMSGVSGPFAVRCGAGGNWVNASATGATYSASCSFANLTDDETIYLRA